MYRHDFFYELPEALIAQYPPAQRGDSRLLCLERDSGLIQDRQFKALSGLLRPGDLLIFNDTRVIPARLYGRKASGGRIEILVERLLDNRRLLAQVRASKSPKPGTLLTLEGGARLEVAGREGEFYLLINKQDDDLAAMLELTGHTPLPPYIKRDDEELDKERYQTIFAKTPGAVAAPTAGLHFTVEMLDKLKAKGVQTAFVTLHVGAGTFQPVRAETLAEHTMHSEWFTLEQSLVDDINRTKAAGGRIIAVGTTVVRSLESAWVKGELTAFQGETDIFIYPGYQFQVVDGLITNFHLPESTLLMLVCAFAGRERVLRAYQHAVQEQYRFFSYGDAMFVY